jgi:hypothetical protein
MVVAGLVFFLVGAAALAQQLSHFPVGPIGKVNEALLSIPFVSWIAMVLPDPTPPALPLAHLITFVAFVPLAVCGWRFHHHRERFRDEEKARDLSDI